MRRTPVLVGGAAALLAVALYGLSFLEPSLRRSGTAVARRPPAHDYALDHGAAETAADRVRHLHARGITGRGVGIAIIDRCLLTEHVEYADRLRLYEEIDTQPRDAAHWHGTAVASIAAGKTIGVAPEADLYFIGVGANWAGEPFHHHPLTALARVLTGRKRLAVAIRRVLEVNRGLPAERKIRVLSLSVGWGTRWFGLEETRAAVEEARRAGLFVSSIEMHPEPMGPFLIAASGSANEYARHPIPAGSWTIAYIAGRYALAVQENPSTTPETFVAER